MPLPDTDLNSPEFALIRARLARAYLAHKGEVGIPGASDGEIVERIDAITALPLRSFARETDQHHEPFLTRYAWFAELVERFLEGREGKPLNG
jgi:hypothetical protein